MEKPRTRTAHRKVFGRSAIVVLLAASASMAGITAPRETSAGDVPSGTPQDLNFTGAIVGRMKDAGLPPEGLLRGCSKTDTGFTLKIAGLIEKETVPYQVDISILAYKKPGTYEVSKKMNLSSGASVFVKSFDKTKFPMGLIASGGTVQVNTDERSGQVDVDLKGGFGRPERAHIKGSWKCPPQWKG
jgi:hypothetical protein